MKKLEKILVVGGIVIGLSLVGYGLHRDNKKPDEPLVYTNSLIKVSGLISFIGGVGFGLGRMLKKEDERYFEEQRKKYPNQIVYPRQKASQKGL